MNERLQVEALCDEPWSGVEEARSAVKAPPAAHLFLLGADYHLGDLLWITAVLREYRRQVRPPCLLVGCPDRPISRVLEHNPLIDDIVYGEAEQIRAHARRRFGARLVVHDLRIVPVALAMVRQWGRRLPWLYYRDLWLRERGQWLANFLCLGRLHDFRPELCLVAEDRVIAHRLPSRYVVLAPHIGQYSLPLAGEFWRRVKGWPPTRWIELAQRLRRAGYEPVTLAAAGQAPVPGTMDLLGLPIRQVAGVIERAAALVTVESGLWFVAAGLSTPFLIVPWWLPRSIDWAAPMKVPYRLIYRSQASVDEVLVQFHAMVDYATV